MPIELFNPYDIRVPVVAENTVTKETYTLSVLPKTSATLLENYTVAITTAASFPRIEMKTITSVEKSDTTKAKGK